MTELISSLQVPTGTESSSGRKYDYTQIYPKDDRGDEAKENARVWNVYLDERENYDAAMIQNFRNIIDNLLTFAALFSGVVATFVVTTASALSPDNTLIIAALLVENNQLLRAVGNSTRVNAVPTAALAPGSPTHSTIDLWVNGLFFASLALSLLTTLAAVLVKQWLQSYTLIVSGSAKDRALISHYRFRGFINWHLPTVVESLPFILKVSLALFLAGFALYAFQLSRPICWAIVAISGIASVFYSGSVVLSVVFIDCPYRIPFIWRISQYAIYPCHLVKQVLICLWQWLRYRKFSSLNDLEWPAFPGSTRRMAEYRAVFPLVSDRSLKNTFFAANEIVCDALSWAFNHSNQSVKDVIVEAVTGLLHDWTALCQDLVVETHKVSKLDFENVKGKVLAHDLFPTAVDYSLKKLSKRKTEPTENQDTLEETPCAQLLDALLTTTATVSPSDKAPYMELPLVHAKHDWKNKVQDKLDRAYCAAALKGDHLLARKLLNWGAGILPMSSATSDMPLLHAVARRGDTQTLTDILDRKPGYINQIDRRGFSALHVAALHGNFDAVAALVKRGASLETLSASTHERPMAPVDLALLNNHPEVVAYLLDHRAGSPAWALHEAAKLRDTQMAKVFLDRGWSKWERNALGQTPMDVAVALGNVETARFLGEYTPASAS